MRIPDTEILVGYFVILQHCLLVFAQKLKDFPEDFSIVILIDTFCFFGLKN